MNKETLREKMRELELNASLTDLFFNLFPRLNVDELFNITKAVKEIFNRHSFISQSESKERLEVEITDDIYRWIIDFKSIYFYIKDEKGGSDEAKQQAIDFCKRFNLKIKEEGK